MDGGDQPVNGSPLTIQDLPQLVQELFARAHYELVSDTRQPADLFVRYLRRKAGRGLAIIYEIRERPHTSRCTSSGRQTISLTLDEQALVGSSIRITPEQARNAPLEQYTPGIVKTATIGMALQAFPADDALQTLADACNTGAGSSLLPSLQEAAHVSLTDDRWRLLAARTTTVRYKPASRCVLRYDLTLENEKHSPHSLSLFGKVYADPVQARTVYELTQQLFTEQMAFQGSTVAGYMQHAPFLPQPLLYKETRSLVLNAAVEPRASTGELRTGSSVLQPRMLWEHGGKTVSTELPTEELRLAAIALARLHTSKVKPDQETLRAGSQEAKRARQRAGLLTGYYPAQAADIQDLAQALAQRLESFQPPIYRPAHGGFKASQLLYHDDTVSVVDFDGFCLADPALDVGYFLAYLRPSGLWYGRRGMRAWFEAAADIFTTTYARALQELGVSSEETAGILLRSQLYTAALLFKIATRRVNRLNSPRTQELAAMLQEMSACLTLTGRMNHAL